MDHLCNDAMGIVLAMCHSEDVCNIRHVNKAYSRFVYTYLCKANHNVAKSTKDCVYFGCNKDRWMSYDDCRRTYRVPKPEMAKLEFTRHPNPYRRCASPIDLYRLSDVIPASLRRFPSLDSLCKYNARLARGKRTRAVVSAEKNEAAEKLEDDQYAADLPLRQRFIDTHVLCGVEVNQDQKGLHIYLDYIVAIRSFWCFIDVLGGLKRCIEVHGSVAVMVDAKPTHERWSKFCYDASLVTMISAKSPKTNHRKQRGPCPEAGHYNTN